MLLDDTVIERANCKGFLKKQGGKWKTWKNRFFVLDENTLYYLESSKDREPLGVIYLQGLVIEGAEHETKWKWSFSITTQTSTSIQSNNKWQERKYVIQANDEKDFKMWLDALRNAVFQMKQAAVSAKKDSPSAAHSHVRGSKPAADRVNHVKHQSRSTDPTPSLLVRQTSTPTNSPQSRRVFSADADMFNSENEYNSAPQPVSSSIDPRASFRKSVFEKAVNGLFAQPSSEIAATINEKDRKAALLRNISLRGSGNLKSVQETKPSAPSVEDELSPWDKRAGSPFQDVHQTYSSPRGNNNSANNNNNSDSSSNNYSDNKNTNTNNTTNASNNTNTNPTHPNPINTNSTSYFNKTNYNQGGKPTTKISPQETKIYAANNRELNVLVTPWSDLAREALFALLKIKTTHPLYAKTTLRVRIMASSVPERTKEELISRGVEVAALSWDDELEMQSILKTINKVVFLPAYSQLMVNWAAAILKATCCQPNKISQFVRVGVTGMDPPTRLGQWGQTIDAMFEEEGITNTTVLVDQMYQDICPLQGVRGSTPLVVPVSAADATISPVDARDVAVLLGTILLRETPTQSSDITIHGPVILTYKQIAQIMNDTMDIPLSFSTHPPQNVVLREVFEVFKQGTPSVHNRNNERIESIIGRPLYSFEAFIMECILKRRS